MFKVYEKGAENDYKYLRLVENSRGVTLHVANPQGITVPGGVILTVSDGGVTIHSAVSGDLGFELDRNRYVKVNGMSVSDALHSTHDTERLKAENAKLKAEIAGLKKQIEDQEDGPSSHPYYTIPERGRCDWLHSAFDGKHQIAVSEESLYIKDHDFIAKKLLDEKVITGLLKVLAEKL